MLFLLPLLTAALCYLIGQEVGEYTWYLSEYQDAVQKPRGDYDPSPHLEALRWALRYGRRAGAMYGSIAGFLATLAAVHRGLSWWSLPIGLVAGIIAAAAGGYLRFI
jgi:hypothetical protein